MPKIKKMSDALSHLIAAGEVVERAASVIKELVENSIDADATLIQINLEQLGLSKIIVTDNGTGMDKADLHLAFLAHATSKINKQQDLLDIKTLGFRGEALPSIASVAKVILASRMQDEDGYYVQYHQTTCVDEGMIAMNVGTKVIVSDLFYNTPARFKYLKSEISERNAILDLFDKLALSHPEIKFVLTFDGKVIKQTPGESLMPILLDAIFGRNMAPYAKYFETTIQKIKISGYLFEHHVTRTRKKDIHLFINRRAVKNYALTQGVIEGYHSYLMTGRYPICVLYIDMDPSLVDVNVHPQKLEVKIANELMISSQLTDHIKSFLRGPIKVDDSRLKDVKKDVFKTVSMDEVLAEIKPKTEEFLLKDTSNLIKDDYLKEDITDVIYEERKLEYDVPKLPDFDYIGTLAGTYLIFQNKDGMYMIDQHAAAERIRYEYYEQKVADLSGEYYELLVPEELLLTSNDMVIVDNHLDAFEKLGFKFSNHHLIAHPIWLREKEIDVALESMIQMLSNEKEIDYKKLRNQLAKDISCKGAIKANHQLSTLEIQKLIKDLRECLNPYTCPHGRPVLIKLSYYEIERMFKRIVS